MASAIPATPLRPEPSALPIVQACALALGRPRLRLRLRNGLHPVLPLLGNPPVNWCMKVLRLANEVPKTLR